MMDKSFGFENLIIWQKSHQFAVRIYDVIRSFPQEEFLGLTSQLRTAVVAIATNIAKGNEKYHNDDKLWFFTLAEEAMIETDYYLILAKSLEYISEEDYKGLKEELGTVQKFFKSYVTAIRKQPHN
jgi:four helix bundle protein